MMKAISELQQQQQQQQRPEPPVDATSKNSPIPKQDEDLEEGEIVGETFLSWPFSLLYRWNMQLCYYYVE